MAASRTDLSLTSKHAHIAVSVANVGKLDCPRVGVPAPRHRNADLIRLNAAYCNRNNDFYNRIRIGNRNFSEVDINDEILSCISASADRTVQSACNTRLTAAADVKTLLLSKSMNNHAKNEDTN